MDRAVILVFLAFPLAIIYLYSVLNKGRKNGKKPPLPSPPGPSGLPLVGNMLQEFNHDYLYQLSKKYGPLMTLHLGSVPTLIVSSARMAKEVYKTNDVAFSNRPSMLGQQTLSYNGVDIAFSPYSDYWREVRKFGTLHLFTNKRSQSFRPIREEEVSVLLKSISDIADANSNDVLVDLNELTLNLTSSVISRVAFGKRNDGDAIGREKFKRVFTETQVVFSNFFFTDYFPTLGWMDKVTGLKGRLDQTFKDLDAMYQELIEEHLKPGRRQPGHVDDFIDIMLDELNKGSSNFNLTINTIKGVLMNLFIGGTDTSSSSVVWTMTALMRAPAVMKKAQEEVRRVIGNKGRVDEDDIQNLPYIRAVVKESMRLYPPFPLLVPRETMETCVIGPDPDHMYEIKPKTVVFVNAWAIGRDPEAWENPFEFRPERMLERPNLDFKGQNFELIPFGGGRRGCPGITLGATVVELTISNILYAFDWKLPDGVKIEDIDNKFLPGLTMQRKNKLYLRPTTYQGYRAAGAAN